MSIRILLSVFCALLLLTACDSQEPLSKADSGKKKKAKTHLVEVIKIQAVESSLTHRWHGSLQYNDIVHVYNQETGRIDDFKWREGDTVKQGELLVHLDDRLLKAERTKLQARIRQAKSDLRRLQRLMDKRAISNEDVEHAKTALEVLEADDTLLQIRLGYFQIFAPFDAVITERLVNLGDVVSQHTHLLTLSNPESLVAKVHISENFLADIRLGMSAKLEQAHHSQVYKGILLRIHPNLHPSTRQATAEIAFKKRPKNAFAGQSITAILESNTKARLLIPIAALKRDEQGEYVFLLQENNKAKRQTVHSGQYVAEQLEIKQGLTSGDQLIVNGFLGLNDGKKVKVVTPHPEQ